MPVKLNKGVEKTKKKAYCVCELCGAHISGKYALARHRRRHFPENMNVKCKDVQCDDVFIHPYNEQTLQANTYVKAGAVPALLMRGSNS